MSTSQTVKDQAEPTSPRCIFAHCANLCNESIKIEVLDGPGDGGANHRYDITGFDTENNPSASAGSFGKCSFSRAVILFQNGPIKEKGVNGVTNEVLLAIVADRLEGFQRGRFACDENAAALTAVQSALAILASRTSRRVSAGVEGTHGTTPGEIGHQAGMPQ